MLKRHRFKIIFCLISLSAYFLISAVTDRKPPYATITNGLIHAGLYLPDTNKGYYRAARFDWSGIISDLEYGDHHYYGQWFPKYDPKINDAIMGPVEAFDPIGFEDAKSGETFLKIGVGELIRPDSMPYNFMRYYGIANSGKWNVKTSTDGVEFRQVLKGRAHSYEYTKMIKLEKGKPVMVISHTLKNTGDKTIETSVFDHNFFVIDSQLTGDGFVITFPCVPKEKVNVELEDYARLQNNQLIFLKSLNGRSVSFKDITNGNGADYNIIVENHNTGAGVKITADRGISKLVFWSWTKTVCPEPYIKINVQPGATFTWSINYEYYNCNIVKK